MTQLDDFTSEQSTRIQGLVESYDKLSFSVKEYAGACADPRDTMLMRRVDEMNGHIKLLRVGLATPGFTLDYVERVMKKDVGTPGTGLCGMYKDLCMLSKSICECWSTQAPLWRREYVRSQSEW